MQETDSILMFTAGVFPFILARQRDWHTTDFSQQDRLG